MEVLIRAVRPEDRAFIISTWCKGQLYGNSFFTAVDSEAYFTHYPKYITSILDRAEVRVACFADDEDIILGYAVMSQNALHWVFVKKALRSEGIANKLIAGASVSVITSLTKPGQAIAAKKGWRFNPWL